jgi:hypothetical protein
MSGARHVSDFARRPGRLPGARPFPSEMGSARSSADSAAAIPGSHVLCSGEPRVTRLPPRWGWTSLLVRLEWNKLGLTDMRWSCANGRTTNTLLASDTYYR